MKRLLPLLACAAFGIARVAQGAAAAPAAESSVDAALAAAKREQRPLLLDFQAQWCYSCYYMATHVLSGAKWQPLKQRVHLTEVDADSPDGAAWMKKLAIKALPSYVVLKADGSELGRIVAEQPPEKFYAALKKILAGHDAIDALMEKAKSGAPADIAAVLASLEARDELQAGLDWYGTLPEAQRKLADNDAQVTLWRDRLRMEAAAKGHENSACVSAAQHVLARDIGCDRYYVMEQLLTCSEKMADAQRKAILAKQQAPLEALLDKQVLIAAPQCADQRTAVFAAAELAKALGDKAAESAVLDRAIAFVRKQLGDNYAQDRNLADNLRVYLVRAGRDAELDALMPKLMAAYPDDYVYAYRYGRTLLERNQPAEALKYLDQAAAKTFGVNRLIVAQLRVKALLALKRRGDAEKVAADALAANGPWFPEEAEKLKKLLES